MESINMSVPAPDHSSISHNIGEPHKCFGIDIQPVCSAPFGAIVRIGIYSDNADSISLKSLITTLSGAKPLLMMSPFEALTIIEDI